MSEFLLLDVHGVEKAYLGRGRVGKGGQKSETSKQAPTRKTKAAVDRRQNNRMLIKGSVRPALRSEHRTTQLLCRTDRVTKTVSVAPPLGIHVDL